MVAALLAMFGTITRSFRLAPVKCALHMSTIFSVIVPISTWTVDDQINLLSPGDRIEHCLNIRNI